MTSRTTSNYNLQEIYSRDYFLWLELTAKCLKEKNASELDFDNLLEEIQTMGRSEKRAIESNLEILLMHLLKYKYQPTKRTNSWLYTIYEHRDRIIKALRDSPSLKTYYQQVFTSCYQNSRKRASLETGLNIDTFPENCPFDPELTLDSEYFPP